MTYVLQSQHLETGEWADVLTFHCYTAACEAWRAAVRTFASHVRMEARR